MKNKSNRLVSKYGVGYLEPRGDMWYTVVNKIKMTTKLRATAENRSEAMRILNERARVYLASGIIGLQSLSHRSQVLRLGSTRKSVGTSLRPDDPNLSLFKIIKQYFADHPDISAATKRQYDTSFNYFIPQDLPLDYERILATVSQINQSSKLNSDTRRRYLSNLRRFFKEYVLPRRYMDRNPLDLIVLPVRKRKLSIPLYTESEVHQALAYFESDECRDKKGANVSDLYRLAFNLFWLTGMRPAVELVRMRREDILLEGKSPVGIRIRGKGDRSREFKERFFPLVRKDGADLFPELRNVVTDLLRIGGDPLLFPWKAEDTIRDTWYDALQWAGIERGDRKLYTLRASARYHLTVARKLPSAYVNSLMGHSQAVAEREYENTKSLADMMNLAP